MHKLRTIDVWDTLLRRDCHPEFVKLATARHLLLAQTSAVKSVYRDQWALYQARVDAESVLAASALAAGRDDEYAISAVMQRWLETVTMPGMVSNPALAHTLVEYELQVEIERCYPDPGIAEFLQAYPAERTAFLSDFYMNASMLSRLLAAKGFGELVSDGIASCDVGLNKRSGRLFQHVHALHGLAPAEHVHVGDNAWSDIEPAERLGMTAVHYTPAADHTARVQRERLFSSRDALFAHARALCRTDAATVATDDPERAAAFRLGVEASPLFIGFALWIAEQALTRGLDKVCFSTGESGFLRQLFLTLFPRGRHCGHCLPETVTLPAGRLVTSSAALREFLIESGLREESRIGVVDIGQRSAIHDDLALALPQSHLHGMYLELRGPGNTQTSNATQAGYALEDPVRDVATDAFDTFWLLGCERISPRFREGVLFAAERWRPLLDACVVSAAELRDQALKVYQGLQRLAREDAASLSLQIAQHDPFEFGDRFAPDSIPPLSTVVLSPFVRRRRRDMIEFLQRAQASAAIAEAAGAGWLHRKLLLLALRAANRVQVLRIKGRRSQRHA